MAASSGAIDVHLANISGASPLVFEGATVDGTNKTTFAVTDPTGVRTITFPDASITVNAAGNISGTTLASNVVNSSLTSVGTLSSGSITSGFGSISTTNNITTSANISSTGSGTITSAGTLTASNGLTQTTGSLNLTATAGALTLSGLSASSVNLGSNDITFTSGHLNTTATGINNTAIGATTKSTGAFTTLTSTGATDLANAGASNVTIATTGTGNVTIGNSTGTFALTSSGGLNVTTGGALTGVASIDTITHSATAIGFTGTGAITSGSATNISLTSGTTGNVTVDSGSTGSVLIGTGVNAKTITIGNATDDTFSLNSSGLNVTSGGALTGVASINTVAVSATAATFAAAGTISSTGANALTLDSGTTGNVNIGNGANAKTVTIGNSTGATALNFTSGTGLQTFGSSAVTTDAFNFNANSITTGAAVKISATSLTTTGSAFTILGPSSTNLLNVSYVGVNFGAIAESGAFISNTSIFDEEFDVNKNVTAITADTTTGLGDTSAFTYDTFTGAATTYSTPTSITGGVGRFSFPATSGTGFVFGLGRTVANYNGIYLKANLPVVQMKWKPSSVAVTEDMRIGLFGVTTAASGTNDVSPSDGIYFSNENGTSWVGVVRSGSANVGTATCTGTISTSQFSVGKIVVESATSVHFYMDYDASNGIAYTDCGTVSGANPTVALTLGLMNIHTVASASTIDVDYMRTWQDDSDDSSIAAQQDQPARMFDFNGTQVDQSAFISGLQSETAPNILTKVNDYLQTGWDFATDFVAARVTAIRGYFDEIFTKKIHTEQICLKKSDGSEVCVDGDQIQSVLDATGASPVATPVQKQVAVPTSTPIIISPPTSPSETAPPTESVSEPESVVETPVIPPTTSPEPVLSPQVPTPAETQAPEVIQPPPDTSTITRYQYDTSK